MTALARLMSKQPQKAVVRPIRVMLVDDSNVARAIFARLLSENGDIVVVAEAANSDEAMQILHAGRQVDVILLDIEMPQRSGLDALPDILVASKGASVIVVSSFAEENGPAAIQSLSLGACDTLAKPGLSGFGEGFSDRLVEKVTRLGRSYRHEGAVHHVSKQSLRIVRPKCLAIGASTGGIPVIQSLLKGLDPQLDCPVFIVQHLPTAFMDFFARQLSAFTNRTISVAKPGAIVEDGHVYVAPGDAHLICRRTDRKVVLDHVSQYSDSRYCPSVDALFASVAEVYGSDALAIVLSGMGNDGLAGARLLASHRATILVQDPESSVVWGMPGAIARDGLASAVLNPAQLSDALSGTVQR
jgi:two-component system, chemotaxis family, protein-glutamate methylesterase/glutaminase